MFRNYLPSLLLAAAVLFSSCEKEEDPSPTDYSIESTSAFELVSQHPNGWIKEGKYALGENEPLEEFEYYENGYIKSAKLYASYPQQHLYMEVSRSEDNKPLWSKYYTPAGELWFETEYKNGHPSVKTVYSEEGTAIHTYTNGELSSVEFTAADKSSTSTTIYNAASGTRNLIITSGGETILDENYPYREQVGAGIYTSNQVPVANPFRNTEITHSRLNHSFSQSPTWQNDADPIEYMFPYRLFDEFYNAGNYFATKYAISTELYQSVIEQYPVTEQGVLIGGGSYHEGLDQFQNEWEVQDSLSKVYEEDPALYKLKYGNEYVSKAGYGKFFFIIGAVRNLPTNSSAATEIKNIAQKRLMEILTGDNTLTTNEQEILNKVWFEVKFFSNLKNHRNGQVLNSVEDYENAFMQFESSQPAVVQLQYESVEDL